MSTEYKRMKLDSSALESDHLSSLSDDCLYDIFSRLNHDDLDEMSELSERLRGTTNQARNMACKTEATTIIVTQDNTRQFSFTFTLKNKELQRTVKTSMKNISQRITELKGKVNIGGVDAESVLDKVIILINRFSYYTFKFEKVYVTKNFMEFFERISANHDIETVCFEENCVFSLDNESREKFLSLILRANPDSFEFNVISKTGISNESFIRNYGLSVDEPILIDLSLNKHFLKLHEEETKCSLAKYISLDLPNVVINTNWISDVVTTRLRMNEVGKWSFLIDRDLTVEEICDEISSDDSSYSVTIDTEEITRNNTTFFLFTAKFCFRRSNYRMH